MRFQNWVLVLAQSLSPSSFLGSFEVLATTASLEKLPSVCKRGLHTYVVESRGAVVVVVANLLLLTSC